MASNDSAIRRDLKEIDDIFSSINIVPFAKRLYESIKKDTSTKQTTKAATSKPSDPVKSEEACPIVPVVATVAKSSQ